jgi:hypothetical protein
LGWSLDPLWGDPIDVTAEVLNITDGKVDAGDGLYEAYERRTSALLKIDYVLVAVSRFRGRTMNTPGFWAHFGVDAADRDAIQMVAKATVEVLVDLRRKEQMAPLSSPFCSKRLSQM